MTDCKAESAVICLPLISSWTLDTRAGSLTICWWPLKMSAAESPSSWATFWISASRSATESMTARSNRSSSAGDLPGMFERLLLHRAEHRLDPMGDAHHHPRTHADSFTHDYPVSVCEGGRTTRMLNPGTYGAGRTNTTDPPLDLPPDPP